MMYTIKVHIPVIVVAHGKNEADARANAINQVVNSYETVPTFDPMLLDGIRILAEDGKAYPDTYAEIVA